jgi:hypothetical protein
MHPPGSSMTRRAGLLGGALLLMAQSRAPGSTPAESARGLVGLIRVGLPTPASSAVVTAGGVSYGWLDPAADLDRSGHRVGATLAAAVAPLPYLSLAADVRGYLDVFPHSSAGSETNLYGEPRLTPRFSRSATEDLYWGAEAEVRFVGAQAPSVSWPATSGSVRGLLGVQLPERTWLGTQLGFHVDRSAAVVPDPASVSASDRRTLESSSWNAVQWGVGASHRLDHLRTELIGELSGEALVGARAPSLLASPWQLGMAARQPLSGAISLCVTAEVGLSAQHVSLPNELSPISPRLSGGVSVLWRLGSSTALAPATPSVHEEPARVAPVPASPAPVTAPVAGTVVDEGGRPLPDAQIQLTRAGAQPAEARSSESGGFSFAEVPEGSIELRVSAAGFDAVTVAISQGQERTREIVLHPSVPAGQVRGRVLDLAGTPVLARVSITPGEHAVQVSEDGSFAVELAPGRYTVKLEHTSFATQQRVIVLRDRGVVILNIALSR